MSASNSGRKRKTWQEKLADNKGFPKVCEINAKKSKRWGTGTFVIPAPMEVAELMSRVPRGKLTTIDGAAEGPGSAARRHHRLPHHDGHLCVDRRARGRRGGSRRQAENHGLLADPEDRRGVEPQSTRAG